MKVFSKIKDDPAFKTDPDKVIQLHYPLFCALLLKDFHNAYPLLCDRFYGKFKDCSYYNGGIKKWQGALLLFNRFIVFIKFCYSFRQFHYFQEPYASLFS